ncbi:hypothetical protein R3P38DRAFT_3520972 [Favolaschia claudopus]|uniref:Uncharacterized protein n=1 Tax=Favolaschia claudopus TaxID=2862362 RepID=A0AAW0BND1_9AGAR
MSRWTVVSRPLSITVPNASSASSTRKTASICDLKIHWSNKGVLPAPIARTTIFKRLSQGLKLELAPQTHHNLWLHPRVGKRSEKTLRMGNVAHQKGTNVAVARLSTSSLQALGQPQSFIPFGAMGPPTGIPQPFGSFAGWNPAPPSGNMMPPHQPVSMSGPRYSSAQGPGSMTSLLGGLTPAPGALVPVYSAAARPSASSTPVAGYSASHLYYRSDQERRAKQAFASPYKGSVEFRLCVMPENKTVAKLVGSVLECIKEVPAHIGHADLLETGMRAITHEWRRFAVQMWLCGETLRFEYIDMKRRV